MTRPDLAAQATQLQNEGIAQQAARTGVLRDVGVEEMEEMRPLGAKRNEA